MRRGVLALPVAGLAAAFFAAGCGDLYSDPADPAEGNPSFESPEGRRPVGRIVDAGVTVPHDDVAACSATPRFEGSECTAPEVGRVCEYGSSPDMQCNTTVACTATGFSASWLARPSTLCPSYQCPKAAAASIDGTDCALPSSDAGPPREADELVCAVDDSVCACTTGPDALHAHARKWVCTRPAAGCPAERPLAGQACTTKSICDYGSCAWKRGLRMECSAGGVWQTGVTTCN